MKCANLKIVSGCFNEGQSVIGHNVDGKHNFKSIHTPIECQIRCQNNDECAYFVVWLQGKWKGCWLKTKKAKRSAKPDPNAIMGPKFC